jgi:LPXTG-motif cell wall-anchored protein
MRRAARLLGTATAVAGLAVGIGAAPASAAPFGNYVAWSLEGGGGSYTASGRNQTVGFPGVTVTSTSRAPADVGSGASTWIPEGTGFGARFGSSRDQVYLSLRPAADDAGSPSVTTFTFDAPTPVGRWGLALGDIDAEALEVSGTDADGDPLTGAQVGLVEAFSYCDASPRSSTCSGQSAPYVLPTATVAGDRVTLEDTQCPIDPTRCDTSGASAWVSPTVPVRTLTVTSTWRQGSPSYQAWLATESRWIQGAIDPAPALDRCPSEVLGGGGTLFTADGRYLFEESGSDGSAFQFGPLYPATYVLRIDLPDHWALEDPAVALRTIDTTAGSALNIVPLARPTSSLVTVTVVNASLRPVRGALVRLVRGSTTVGPAAVDRDGVADLGRVPTGRWTIVVTSPGQGGETTQRVDLVCQTESPGVRIRPPRATTPPATATPSEPEATSGPAGLAAGRPPGELAATGGDPVPALALAGTLLLLGGGLVVWSRRRPRRTH